MMDQGSDAEQEALLSFFYLCPVGILQLDERGRVQMLNPMAAQLLMPFADGLVIANLFEVLERYAPDLRNLVSAYVQPRGRICNNRRLFMGARNGDARVLSCTLLKTSGDCIMVMLDDVSEQVDKEQRLKEADTWMAAVFGGMNDFACFSLDATGLIDSWNKSGARQTGYTSADVVGQTLDMFRPAGELVLGQTLDHLEVARREGWHLHEDRCLTRDGLSFYCQILVTALKENDGKVSGFSVVLRDVSERKMRSDEMRRLLTMDHLTGAANRNRFFELAPAEVALWRRYSRPVSMLMLDTDHLKHINDTYGHAAGDVALQALVSRCKAMLRPIDLLARFGGEEFVILLPGTDIEGAADLARRICQALAREPITHNRDRIPLTVSIGCASTGDDVQDLDTLLKASDVALYEAKQLGRNRSCVHQSQRQTGLAATCADVVAAQV